MAARVFLFLFAVATLSTAFAQRPDAMRLEIDLQDQMIYLLEDGQLMLASPISSGRAGHQTTRGSFRIIEKERNHFSNLYGKIVDARGTTIVADADADMPLPRGGRFVPAPMRYFMRFNGAEGMHAGYLPGYAASHGCVRLPEANAIAIFQAVEVGTPVTVFGTTPIRRVQRNPSLTAPRRRLTGEPRSERRFFDPFAPPGWWR
ncbi:MAG: L,D-transpeptidase [Verrucomicrobiota bacterium]|nr:L,D-transpeptidase [Verrucomicrobiota bacterium]